MKLGTFVAKEYLYQNSKYLTSEERAEIYDRLSNINQIQTKEKVILEYLANNLTCDDFKSIILEQGSNESEIKFIMLITIFYNQKALRYTDNKKRLLKKNSS